MLFNTTFTSYRRVTVSNITTHSAVATITNGSGHKMPLTESLRATLGVDSSSETYLLITEETDIQVTDKFTISGSDYFVDGAIPYDIGSRRLTRVILNKKKT